MNTLVLRLKEAATDSTLKKYGELTFPIRFTGDSLPISKMVLGIVSGAKISLKITGPAYFYTNYAGTEGQTKYIEKYSPNNVYFKPDEVVDDDLLTITISNCDSLTGFGIGLAWSPTERLFVTEDNTVPCSYHLVVKSSQLQFMDSLAYIIGGTMFDLEYARHFDNCKIISFIPSYLSGLGADTELDITWSNGVIKSFKSAAPYKNGKRVTYKGDLKKIKSCVNMVSDSSLFTYTGDLDDVLWPSIGNFSIENSMLPSDAIDNLLIAIDNGKPTPSRFTELKLKGMRTPKSNAAVSSLLSRVTTFRINGILPVATV